VEGAQEEWRVCFSWDKAGAGAGAVDDKEDIWEAHSHCYCCHLREVCVKVSVMGRKERQKSHQREYLLSPRRQPSGSG
jgi:hypothetical protein